MTAHRDRPKPVPRRMYAPPRSTVARVRRYALEHGLLVRGQPVLVAISGGPDSTCLLLVLAALRRSLSLELRAAHFDHRLRGARVAQRELRFVQQLCDALDVPLHTGSGDVRARAKSRKQSIEEAARELRYRFLAQAARRSRSDVVAAGHTRDDQAETVLLHLLRGSGLRGLAAMAPSAPWPVATRTATPRLVRPLLELTRADTERCCREAGLTPIDDASNRSPAHLRNRLRAELLPLLREYNPRVDNALARLADAAASDVAALEQLAGAAVETTPSGARVQRRVFAALPPALQRHAVRLAFARVAGAARGLSERHVRALVRAAASGTGAHLDLPRGVRVDVTRDAVAFARGASAQPAPLPARPVPLPIPGAAELGPWRIEAALLARRPRNVASADGTTAYVDAAAAGDRLLVRRRRPGDRFQPLGLARPKKLQDFLVDAHVPRAERDALPIVSGSCGIVWIPAQRPSEWAKVGPRTKQVLRLRAKHAPA